MGGTQKYFRVNPLRMPKSGIPAGFGHRSLRFAQTPSIRLRRIAFVTAASMPPFCHKIARQHLRRENRAKSFIFSAPKFPQTHHALKKRFTTKSKNWSQI
jgi:hypothetical protein